MRIALLLLAVLIAATGLPAGARAAVWESDFLEIPDLGTDATLGYSGRPAVAGPDGRIHLLFQKNLDFDLFRVGYVTRDPDGQWSAPEMVSQSGRSALNPIGALDRDGRLHVLWEDVTAGDAEIVHCIRNLDGTWSQPVAVAGAPGISSQPRVVVDAFNRVHAVWVDNRTGYRAILHSTAPVDGPWEPPKVLTTEEEAPDEVVLAADGIGGVHVLWREREGNIRTGIFYELVYVRLDSGQGEPPPPVVLVTHSSTAQQPYLEATEDGTLHLVWADNLASLGGSYFEIFYKRYLPGVGWGHDKRFTYEVSEHARPVAVAGPGGTLNIAWEDYRDGNPKVYYRQITPETGWDLRPTVLSGGLGSSQTPSLVALPDERMVVIWTDALATGTTRILVKEGLVHTAP